MKELTIKLTEKGRRLRSAYAAIAVSSKETIRTGMKAVDASPFQTVFVVDEASGQVRFALSQDEEYVRAAKKKGPKTPPPGPAPAPSTCCELCRMKGGYACDDLGDGSCICYGASGGGSGGVTPDDELGTLAV